MVNFPEDWAIVVSIPYHQASAIREYQSDAVFRSCIDVIACRDDMTELRVLERGGTHTVSCVNAIGWPFDVDVAKRILNGTQMRLVKDD